MMDFTDRRSSTRRRTLLKGRIVFNNRCSVLECTIRDVSDTGARIAFTHPVQIPPQLELDIPKMGTALRAQVTWSHGNEYGISFIDGTEVPEKPVGFEITAEIQEVVEEARRRIAHLAGVKADAVTLKVKIDA